jgi:hypothetical protein
MAKLDLHNEIKDVNALNIGTISSSTTTNGNIIDTLGFEATEFVIHAGTITDGVYVPSIYESDDSGLASATVITSDFLIGTTNVTGERPDYAAIPVAPITDATFSLSADSNKVARIGCLNKKRYTQLRLTSSGVSSGGIFGAVATLGYPEHKPTAKDK